MNEERFVLFGKVAPNDWRPIGAIYDELRGMSFTFTSYEEATLALRDLKNILKTYKKHKKVPLTIRAEPLESDLHRQTSQLE